jgi:predicted lipoprotein with Yx(FWY)xxD motif
LRTLAVAALLVLALGGCGDEGESGSAAPEPPQSRAQTETADAPTAMSAARKGTKITARPSEFGRMLFDSRRQAIYIFERDGKGRSRCYGACAKAWPPVYAKGKPVAAEGVRGSLLGTTRRRNGRRQVTYAGQPLYFYAHEAPGEVRCHNVDLNGGLWWVVGPDGRRRP